MAYDLGVDLGTTFTAAAVCADGRGRIVDLTDRGAEMPSVVLIRADGAVLTGSAAERRAATEPRRVAREFKRRLGDPTPLIVGGSPQPATSLLSHLLRAVVGKVSATEGTAPDTVVLTHPASWGPYKRDVFAQVPQLAEVHAVRMITEPEAAAAHYAGTDRVRDGATVAVYDLGGGTFDATVLRKTPGGFEILGTPQGIEGLGGIDFDEAVYDHVRRSLGGTQIDRDSLVGLRRECILAKEALSADTEATIPVLLPDHNTQIRLTRGEFEDMIRPALADTLVTLRGALRSASITEADLTAVLLVGGSSRIPLVSKMVSAELKCPIAVDIHPTHAVALGAATLAPATRPAAAPVSRIPVTKPAAATAPVPVTQPAATPVTRPAAAPAPAPVTKPAAAPTPADALVVTPDRGGADQGPGRRPRFGAGDQPPPLAPPRSGVARPRRTVVAAVVVSVLVLGAVGAVGAFFVLKPGGAAGGRPNHPASVTATVPVGRQPGRVAITRDGRHAYVTNNGADTVSVIDTGSNAVTATIPVGTAPAAVAITPDGRGAYVTDNGADTVTVIDTGSNAVTTTIPVGAKPSGVAIAPDGRHTYVTDSGAGTVTVIDTESNAVTTTIPVGTAPAAVAITPDGGHAYVTDFGAGGAGTVSVIDTGSDTVTATIPVGATPGGVAITPDGRRAYVTNYDSGTVSVIDTAANVVTGSISGGGRPAYLAIAPDGRRAYLSDQDANRLSVIDTATDVVTAGVPVPGPNGAALTPDGRRAYVAGTGSNSVTVVDLGG
jgi:YVTN family beta-propeller protein